jgi:hypothetical protein
MNLWKVLLKHTPIQVGEHVVIVSSKGSYQLGVVVKVVQYAFSRELSILLRDRVVKWYFQDEVRRAHPEEVRRAYQSGDSR